MSAVMSETDSNSLAKPKHAGGRPSKYNTRTLRNTKEYIQSNTDVVPTIAGLARHLNVTRTSIYQWIKDDIDSEFTNTVSMMTDERERKLINGALDGTYNAGAAALILKTSHGYSDRDNNQDAGITVNVGRDKVQITHKNQTLTVESEE